MTLQPGDRFLVDRSGTTYKTTFQNLEESLDIDVDLSYEYTVTVDETPGGSVDTSTVTAAGDDFLEDQDYQFEAGSQSITVRPTQDGPLVDGGYEIVDNTSGLVVNTVFSGVAYSDDGAVLSVSNPVNAPTDLDVDVSFDYPLLQISGSDTISGAFIRVTGTGLGNQPTLRVVTRGSGYSDGQVTVVRDTNTDFKVDVVASTSEGPTGSIEVLTVTDGTDQDKAQFTIQIGSDPATAKTVKVRPGRGIAFTKVYDDSTGAELTDEIQILSTLEEGGGGEGDSHNEPPVFVLPIPPTEPTYVIRTGSLWYNTSDGRTYIAITYPTGLGTFGYDWIDASPSSLNDAVRKDGDTMVGGLYIDGASLYTPHYELERLPLIQNAP